MTQPRTLLSKLLADKQPSPPLVRPVGRPPLPEDQRTNEHSLRFTDKEWNALKAKAESSGLSIARLIARDMSL